MNLKAVVLLSGGIDSSTAAQAIEDGYKVIALSFIYGQCHERELLSAQMVAQKLGITEHFIWMLTWRLGAARL